jgi:hypothetical protein
MTPDGVLTVTTPTGITRETGPPALRVGPAPAIRVSAERAPPDDDSDPPPF